MAKHSNHDTHDSKGDAANRSDDAERTSQSPHSLTPPGALTARLHEAQVRLTLAQTSIPEQNTEVAKAHTEVGNILYHMNLLEEAALHFEKSALLYASYQPPHQLPQADALLRAGCTYLRQSDWVRAEAALETAHDLLPALTTARALAVQIRLSLAIPLLITGRKIRGDSLAQAGKDAILTCSSYERSHLIEYCQTVARAYRYVNDPINLLAFQACAMQCAIDAPKFDAACITETTREYCETLRKRQDYVKVEEILSKAVATIEESCTPHRLIATQLRCDLAVNYAALGDYRLGDQLLCQTRDLLEESSRQAHDLPLVLYHLCELSIARGYFSKAEVAAMEAIIRTSGQQTAERAKCLVLSAQLQAWNGDWRNNPDSLREIDDKLADAQQIWRSIASESYTKNGESLELLEVIASHLQDLLKTTEILASTARPHLAHDMYTSIESVRDTLPPLPKRDEVTALMYATRGKLASLQRREGDALVAYEQALQIWTTGLHIEVSPEVLHLKALIAQSQLSLRKTKEGHFSLTAIDAALHNVEENLTLYAEGYDSVRLLLYKLRRAIRSAAGDGMGARQYVQKLRQLEGEIENKRRLFD
jgi:hypothetical protein